MNWIHSSLTDENGRYDVAYVSLFGIMGAVLSSVVVMCTVSTMAYFRCQVFTVNEVIVNCLYDPQPLGTAIGFACGGFATALAALAGYMVATRTPRAMTTTTVKTERTTEASVPATDEVLEVNVVGTPERPMRPPPKKKK